MIKTEINKMLTRVLLDSLADINDITAMDVALAMQNVTNVICEVYEVHEAGYIVEPDGVRDIGVTACKFCEKACGNAWCWRLNE